MMYVSEAWPLSRDGGGLSPCQRLKVESIDRSVDCARCHVDVRFGPVQLGNSQCQFEFGDVIILHIRITMTTVLWSIGI